MHFFSYLAGKPKSYRNKIAFSAAAVLTSFVFVVWSSTLDGRIAQSTGDLSADNRESGVAAVPFSGGELSKQFDTIQGTLNLLRGNGADSAPALEVESVEQTEDSYQTDILEEDEGLY